MADIDRLDTPAVPVRAKPSPWQRLMDWLRETPQPMRWTLAAESLALAMLVLVVWLPGRPVVEPGFETLSSVTTSTRPTGPGCGWDSIRHSGLLISSPCFGCQRPDRRRLARAGDLHHRVGCEREPRAALDHALAVLRAHREVCWRSLQPSNIKGRARPLELESYSGLP